VAARLDAGAFAMLEHLTQLYSKGRSEVLRQAIVTLHEIATKSTPQATTKPTNTKQR
jgi:hypothetical protein